MIDWLEKHPGPVVTLVLAVFGFFSWLIRKVFTNEKQIAVVETQLVSLNKNIEQQNDLLKQFIEIEHRKRVD